MFVMGRTIGLRMEIMILCKWGVVRGGLMERANEKQEVLCVVRGTAALSRGAVQEDDEFED
jgi:hypothetical protein